MIKYLLIVFSILLIACETEHERHRRLEGLLFKLEERRKLQTKNLKVLQEEEKKCKFSTAKERFAFLHEIKKKSGHRLEHYQYIKKVMISKSKKKYEIKTELRSLTKLKPIFCIFLHDRQGLLVGKFYHKPLYKKIKKGETVEKKKTIEVIGEPYYFRIEIF